MKYYSHTARVLLRRSLATLAFTLFLLIFALAALEIMYRFQVVDTYLPELRRQNEPQDLEANATSRTILVMGDSFTAGDSAYPSIMREALPDHRVINAAVGGTGILEAAVIAPRRFSDYRPSVFVYQIYVGNDLLNINYPVNWSELSAARNLYWVVSRRLRSISWLNQRMGQVARARPEQPSIRDSFLARANAPFDPLAYHSRIYLRAEPALLENSILVRENRTRDYQVLLEMLRELIAYCVSPECEAYVVVIPHCSQVHERYLRNMRQVGARIEHPEQMLADDYPFLAGIRDLLVEAGLDSERVLDPMPGFRESERANLPVYYQNDPHLNDRGQEILAHFILERLALSLR